jgi:hypothetical protein
VTVRVLTTNDFVASFFPLDWHPIGATYRDALRAAISR